MTKTELLKWLQDEYQQWEAFLDEIGTERMDQPGVNGDWSMKDIAAHLTGWQRHLSSRMKAAQRGEPEPPPPWPAHLEVMQLKLRKLPDGHRYVSGHWRRHALTRELHVHSARSLLLAG